MGGAGSPSNTMSLGEASVPSGILIHETVWPQCMRVTDDIIFHIFLTSGHRDFKFDTLDDHSKPRLTMTTRP